MIIPVVLAGGSGTRLWPMSRKLYPKQLIRLTGEHTMIQNTLLRLSGLDNMAPPVIIGNEDQRFIVDQQLSEINIRPSVIFLEPVGRNTAPAVAVAAMHAAQIDPDSLILVLPADHLIADVPKFHMALRMAEAYAGQSFMVTFGIVPDRPETGYGYIRRGKPENISGTGIASGVNGAYAIYEFVEKPDRETAEKYLASGEYCWNSGMFMFKASAVLEELRRFVPKITAACETALAAGHSNQGFFYLGRTAFETCPSDSIDYAVMERTDRGVMVPLDAGWDDLGSWEALWKVAEKDASGNVISGDVISIDVQNSLVYAQSRLVTVLGLENLAVVETPDALLISNLSDTQRVKKIVDTLKAGERAEVIAHQKTIHAWGTIEIRDSEPDYRVRRITVYPKTELPVGNPHCKALVWTMIQGSGRLTVDGKPMELAPHQSYSPPAGRSIVLENIGAAPMIFIEVASGTASGSDHFNMN